MVARHQDYLMVKIEDMNFIKNIKLRTNNPIEAASQVKEVLRAYKVVKIIPEWYLGDLGNFYDAFTEEIATVLHLGEDFTKGGCQTGEKWLEIRYDVDVPDLAAYRHSKNAQPLHTDESYIANPADVMMFYCINKAVKGGATTFIDAPVLVKYMEENAPQLLQELYDTPIRFRKADETRTERIIREEADGLIHFNYNYYCIDNKETKENKDLNQRFFEFLQTYVASSHMIEPVGLNPGEAVLWWDELVLHGRTSFKAEKTNDRFIWKTGLKWQE